MPRIKPTPDQIEGVVARIPEGFIRQAALAKRFRLHDGAAANVKDALTNGKVARENNLFYDTTRLTREQVLACNTWCYPTFPTLHSNGQFIDPPIHERVEARQAALGDDVAALRILELLGEQQGYATKSDLCPDDDAAAAVGRLLAAHMVREIEDLLYDPLRLGENTMHEVCRRRRLEPQRQALVTLLESQQGQTIAYDALSKQYGEDTLREILSMGGFSQFTVSIKVEPYVSQWVRLKDADAELAHKVAASAVRIKDEAWQDALDAAGEVLRLGAKDGDTRRQQVLARSYTVEAAAKRLRLHEKALLDAIAANLLPCFTDPEDKLRIPAEVIEAACFDPEQIEEIAAHELVKVKEMALVLGMTYPGIRRRLHRARLKGAEVPWGKVRGRWNLPASLEEFRARLKQALELKHAQRESERVAFEEALAEQHAREREQREHERQQRKVLRARLLAAFPSWRHEGRAEQQIHLHVGPPNSGKTHDALNTLAKIERGWYLAPLRLLAYEVFDRLNRRGVFCNLLTGEEYIPVPGAKITAATIEMFNPAASGDCIIIDEAQMLADSDRGWAWTRALMEAQAPEIHVIAPQTAQSLIEQMARAANIPLNIIEHQRLAPIKVADQNWTLNKLPDRTILVAFSRRTVLQLKTELEQMKRKVSVVYGNLPPEVRRRQADRFADGETEICIATDAVGMGLNLPADYVCFYEVEKFDGRMVRLLTASEVQQIGGRAGRYGLSQAGEVGATRMKDLRIIRKLFEQEPDPLTHARVAPTVDDLSMIPGSLADKLNQWALLQSIPDELRPAIKTADLSERVELAKMLSDEEVQHLGLSAAVELTNAPTRQSSREYWRNCASAILSDEPMPLPPPPPREINNNDDLEATEWSVSCADIYLWLSRRRDFLGFGPQENEVRQMRADWSMQIDAALLSKLDMSRRCPNCGEPLPLGHRHRLCNNCYFERMNHYRYY